MLHLRVLSALVGIPVILLAAWYGKIALWLLTAITFMLASHEITAILSGLGFRPVRWIIQFGGLSLLLVAYLYSEAYLGMTMVCLVLANMLTMVFAYPKISPGDVFANLSATFYLGNILFFYLIRNLDEGWIWVLLLLTATWASDTFAYFVGRAIGKHKLAPVLSPKKTVEGAVGGVLGSTLVCYSFVYFNPKLPLTLVLLLGIVIGIISLLGDLMESALKRQAKIKDSGQIIPGHGGVLDRFDSLLFTAPLVYYIVKLFII